MHPANSEGAGFTWKASKGGPGFPLLNGAAADCLLEGGTEFFADWSYGLATKWSGR